MCIHTFRNHSQSPITERRGCVHELIFFCCSPIDNGSNWTELFVLPDIKFNRIICSRYLLNTKKEEKIMKFIKWKANESRIKWPFVLIIFPTDVLCSHSLVCYLGKGICRGKFSSVPLPLWLLENFISNGNWRIMSWEYSLNQKRFHLSESKITVKDPWFNATKNGKRRNQLSTAEKLILRWSEKNPWLRLLFAICDVAEA